MEKNTWILLPILVLFPVVFVAFWCGVVYLISLVGGWQRLAAKYAAGSKPVLGKSWSGQYGMMGVANYKGVLNVNISPAGLHLSVMALFRVGHPDLLIPWQDVERLGDFHRFFMHYTSLGIGRPRLTTLKLPHKVMAEAAPYLPG